MKHRGLILILPALLLAGCGGGEAAGPQELTVFAAASLTDAFHELANTFEAENEGVEVLINFAGSSQLAAQLREGVDADVFASANPKQMQVAMDAGRVAAGGSRLFARVSRAIPGSSSGISPAEAKGARSGWTDASSSALTAGLH